MSDLQKTYEQAEARAQALMAEKDRALQKVRDRYAEKLRAANDKAAAAQKAWLDSRVAESLRNRPDGEPLAESLGIDLS